VFERGGGRWGNAEKITIGFGLHSDDGAGNQRRQDAVRLRRERAREGGDAGGTRGFLSRAVGQ